VTKDKVEVRTECETFSIQCSDTVGWATGTACSFGNTMTSITHH